MKYSHLLPTPPRGTCALDHAARWQGLDAFLTEYRHLWQPAPFCEPTPAWAEELPALTRALLALSDDDVATLDADVEALARHVAPFFAPAQACLAQCEVEAWPTRPWLLPERFAVDMPGRKRAQSEAFAAALQPLQQPVLDWCCGKGHLARTLACAGAIPVVGYEWNPALVDAGNALAGRQGLPVRLSEQDVLGDVSMPSDVHAVALHACGDLHRRLLSLGVAQRLPRMSLSPCCYHLTAQDEYVPLSTQVQHRSTLLPLQRDDLRLAVQETVTAPLQVRRQRRRASAWRLGFDGLQRALRGVDAYLPLPSHPPALLRGSFAEFCAWAAHCKGLTLPAQVNHAAWEAHGEQRLHRAERLELARHLFRRPLELWLVLDRVLYLEEQGYAVTYGRFCQRALTPRNLLIDAHALPEPPR